MHDTFWHDRWRSGDIGFHMPKAHPALSDVWARLNVLRGSSVLVPLAGKSNDMVWLAEHGYDVIGIELSEQAVEEFFRERGRSPSITDAGPLKVYRAGPYEMWCGDFFAFPWERTRRIGAVYDRAALVAMPYVMQERYAAKLADVTPAGVPVLLISLDYDPSEMGGPPFPLPRARIDQLFHRAFDIQHIETRDGLIASARIKERGVTRLDEAVFVLTRRP